MDEASRQGSLNLPTYVELRLADAKPRVHGNGFLQLDLPDGRRLHVWDEELPRQEVKSSIHDHAFAFESTVLCGDLNHIWYHFIPDPQGHLAVLQPKRREGTEDTKLESTGIRGYVEVLRDVHILAGEKYSFEAQQFHDTIATEFTATVIRKLYRLDIEPRILVPHGQGPDNEFDREAFDPETLWPFVDKALELASSWEQA